MTTENKLKEYILSKYKSVREFCLQNDFPYSTIDNMFKRERGILGTSVSIVIRVCNCLNIDINELENGNIVLKAPAVIELTEHEKRLIKAYRNKPEMQASIDKLLDIECGSEISGDIFETIKQCEKKFTQATIKSK